MIALDTNVLLHSEDVPGLPTLGALQVVNPFK
jgi:hypothetical protein